MVVTQAQKLDPQIVSRMQAAMLQARRGDLRGARATAEQALIIGKDVAVVRGFLGMLCCQSGDLEAGIKHLRSAHHADPTDLAVVGNLCTALIEAGVPDEALEYCTEEVAAGDTSRRLFRLRGYLLQIREDYDGAAKAYEQVVAADPVDFESWNNLGNARAGAGDVMGSVAALERAAALRPDIAPVRLNVATTLMEAGRLEDAEKALVDCVRDFPKDSKPLLELAGLLKLLGKDSEALGAIERAAALEPSNANLQVELGMEYVMAWDMPRGEESFRKAVAVDPKHAEAHILLGLLIEHTNRPGEFAPLIASAQTIGVDEGAVQFIRALEHRRERRFEEGLEALAAVPADIQPVRCAQLSGQFHDRIGNVDAAFSAFSEMNRLHTSDPSEPVRRAGEYRASLKAQRELVTPEWFAGWRDEPLQASQPSPAFLVGFPRSGTTLLDTMLMGHKGVQVMEEEPALAMVENAIGGIDRLDKLSAVEIAEFRERYFNEAADCIDLQPGKLLVDKSPLHLNKVPVIHRLFPDARFILALRHPCDVLLSCFITNFKLNNAMSNFIDLETGAEVYDLSFGFWEHCRKLMPIRVHEVSYERIVEDSEAELRPLFEYLGLDWREEVLDHQHTAAGRGIISTASYAQVTEPIYKRASGRWTRYRDHLAPVMPTLEPWVNKFGYSL